MTVTTGTLRVGILAILAGLVGAYVIQQVLTPKPVVVAEDPETTLLLAGREIPEGRVVTLGDVAVVKLTESEKVKRFGNLPGLMIVDATGIVGRRVKETIAQGEPFRFSALYPENSIPDIGKMLKPGQRSYTLTMPAGLAGGIEEQSNVDIIFRSTERRVRDIVVVPERTVTLLQSVPVLYVNIPAPPLPSPGAPPRAPAPATVILAVSPDQAKRLQVVQGRGEIMVAPWASGDRTTIPPGGEVDSLTLYDILGIKPQLAAAPPAPFITEGFRRGTLNMQGYQRDAIRRYQSPPVVKPASLPLPAEPAKDFTPAEGAPTLESSSTKPAKNNGNGTGGGN